MGGQGTKRVLGYVAWTVGFTLLLTGLFLKFYVTPRVQKAPLDLYDVNVSDGTGKVVDPTTISVIGPIPLRNLSISKGDPEKGNDDVAVYNQFGRTWTPNGEIGDISYTNEVFAFDRTTGESVNCCGDSPPHEGLTLKFPFGTEKVTYLFWDSTAKAAFPAEYQRTETLNGLTVYVFVSEVPQTLIGPMSIPSALAGQPPGTGVVVFRWYTATTTLWIEPTTGAIVKAGQDANQFATDGGKFVTTLAQTSFVQDEASVEKTAKRVRDQIFQLQIVTTWGWIIGLAVGVPLIVLGFVLVFGSRRREEEKAAAPRSIETLPAS